MLVVASFPFKTIKESIETYPQANGKKAANPLAKLALAGPQEGTFLSEPPNSRGQRSPGMAHLRVADIRNFVDGRLVFRRGTPCWVCQKGSRKEKRHPSLSGLFLRDSSPGS